MANCVEVGAHSETRGRALGEAHAQGRKGVLESLARWATKELKKNGTFLVPASQVGCF